MEMPHGDGRFRGASREVRADFDADAGQIVDTRAALVQMQAMPWPLARAPPHSDGPCVVGRAAPAASGTLLADTRDRSVEIQES